MNLGEWCAQRAVNFREWEEIEMAMYPDPGARDYTIVQSVIRSLANPDCAGSAEVLEAIDRQRAAAS